MKIFVFTLEVRTEEQENNRTLEQFNNGRKKEDVRSGDWQHPALLCCRNEILLLQLSLMMSFIKGKILVVPHPFPSAEKEEM